MNGITLYILGAGCSLPSYPTAENFTEELKHYGETLGVDSVRLKMCVTETARLLEAERKNGVKTIDTLVDRIHRGQLADPSLLESMPSEVLVDNAKIATVAMFLERERRADVID